MIKSIASFVVILLLTFFNQTKVAASDAETTITPQFTNTSSSYDTSLNNQLRFAAYQNITNSGEGGLIWISRYFPLIKGNSWEYGVNNHTFRFTIEDMVNVDGLESLKLYRYDQGAYIYFRADGKGLRRLREDYPELGIHAIFDPPLSQLPANAFIGNSYSNTSTIKLYENSTYFDEGNVQVNTEIMGFENVTLSQPAEINGEKHSTFQNCLKLKHRLIVKKGSDVLIDVEEVYWHAKDLGWVKIGSEYGQVELIRATTYYDHIAGNWSQELHGSDGSKKGDINLDLQQSGSNLSGDVNIDLDDGSHYHLPLQEGYVSGKTASGRASLGGNEFEFALTKNENGITGPYNSNFIGYGTVQESDSSPDKKSSGSSGCFLKTVVNQ